MKDLSHLCIHTITLKPWSLEKQLEAFANKGVGGISVWEGAIAELGAVKAGELLQQYPVEVVSYVRGGFFPHHQTQKRKEAIDHNLRLLDEAAAIGAPLLVLVCGSDPVLGLETSRKQIREGIEQILPYARSVGVKLGIEPLHPMYADTRSAINTLGQANDMSLLIDDEMVGVVVDIYHLWWDDRLETEIKRSGREGKLLAYHICDWKVPTEHMLLDRGLMGEGCIPIQKISNWVSDAGFNGYTEVEIFSEHYWKMNQAEFLDKIIEAYFKLHNSETKSD